MVSYGDVLPAFIIMFALMMLNAPIYVGILSAAMYLAIYVVKLPLTGMVTVMFEGLNKNSLLAIPFFIMAGNFISGGTLGRRLMDVFRVMLGNTRGGLPIACVLSNGVFGAISGSSPAAVAVFGKIIYKPLAEAEGEKLALGVITTAACLSGIIPPSIATIVYCVAADTSVARQFLAGVFPGIAIMIVLGIYLYFVSKSKLNAEPFTWRNFGKVFVRGIPILLLPVFVLGGIYGGFLTPSEAGAFSAAYALIVGLLLGEVNIDNFFQIIKDASIITCSTFAIIATSSYLSRMIILSQIPQMMMAAFYGVSKLEFLIIFNIFMTIVGLFLDPAPAILVLTPIVLPLARSVGLSPIHFGMIMTFNTTMGGFTPPFGLCIFMAQNIMQKSFAEVVKSVIPFIFLYWIVLFMINVFPWMSEYLPSLMMAR